MHDTFGLFSAGPRQECGLTSFSIAKIDAGHPASQQCMKMLTCRRLTTASRSQVHPPASALFLHLLLWPHCLHACRLHCEYCQANACSRNNQLLTWAVSCRETDDTSTSHTCGASLRHSGLGVGRAVLHCPLSGHRARVRAGAPGSTQQLQHFAPALRL